MIKQYKGVRLLTNGNFPFRDKITIDTNRRILYFQKRSSNIIGHINKSIMFNDISIVKLEHRVELLFFSRLIIESNGGSEYIIISGLTAGDAKEIKYLLDNLR